MRRLIAILVTAALVACAVPPPPPPDLSAEEREEFRQDLLADEDKVDIFLQKTRRGVNLTEITLGWFVMILLNELTAHDAGLHGLVHHDDGTAESYLRNDFQANPEAELAAIETLAAEDARDLRLAARDALACLTTIPNVKDPPEAQKAARDKLAADLARLKKRLGLLAAGMAPVPEVNSPRD